MRGALCHRPPQTELIAKLREARAEGKSLELPEIMHLGIAQHSARFNELRARGFVIENELQRDATEDLMTAHAAVVKVHPSDGLYSAEAERACLGAALFDNRVLRGP